LPVEPCHPTKLSESGCCWAMAARAASSPARASRRRSKGESLERRLSQLMEQTHALQTELKTREGLASQNARQRPASATSHAHHGARKERPRSASGVSGGRYGRQHFGSEWKRSQDVLRDNWDPRKIAEGIPAGTYPARFEEQRLYWGTAAQAVKGWHGTPSKTWPAAWPSSSAVYLPPEDDTESVLETTYRPAALDQTQWTPPTRKVVDSLQEPYKGTGMRRRRTPPPEPASPPQPSAKPVVRGGNPLSDAYGAREYWRLHSGYGQRSDMVKPHRWRILA